MNSILQDLRERTKTASNKRKYLDSQLKEWFLSHGVDRLKRMADSGMSSCLLHKFYSYSPTSSNTLHYSLGKADIDVLETIVREHGFTIRYRNNMHHKEELLICW